MGNHKTQNDIAILEKPSAFVLLKIIRREFISCLKGWVLLFTGRFQEHSCNCKWEQSIIAHCNHLLLEFDSSKNLRNLSKTVGIEAVPQELSRPTCIVSPLNLSVTTPSRKGTSTLTWAKPEACQVLKTICMTTVVHIHDRTAGILPSYRQELFEFHFYHNTFHRKQQRLQKQNSKWLSLQGCHSPCWTWAHLWRGQAWSPSS